MVMQTSSLPELEKAQTHKQHKTGFPFISTYTYPHTQTHTSLLLLKHCSTTEEAKPHPLPGPLFLTFPHLFDPVDDPRAPPVPILWSSPVPRVLQIQPSDSDIRHDHHLLRHHHDTRIILKHDRARAPTRRSSDSSTRTTHLTGIPSAWHRHRCAFLPPRNHHQPVLLLLLLIVRANHRPPRRIRRRNVPDLFRQVGQLVVRNRRRLDPRLHVDPEHRRGRNVEVHQLLSGAVRAAARVRFPRVAQRSHGVRGRHPVRGAAAVAVAQRIVRHGHERDETWVRRVARDIDGHGRHARARVHAYGRRCGRGRHGTGRAHAGDDGVDVVVGAAAVLRWWNVHDLDSGSERFWDGRDNLGQLRGHRIRVVHVWGRRVGEVGDIEVDHGAVERCGSQNGFGNLARGVDKLDKPGVNESLSRRQPLVRIRSQAP
ncbi:hypothetical protein BJ742DRAFT_462418 [Cladochytrium replicatum]|nr:hypothetical protein BJ742DRAFT_462418 [Cladochytrium replicatum]